MVLRFILTLHAFFSLAIAIQANFYRNLIVRVRPVFMITGLPLLRRFLILVADKGKLTLSIIDQHNSHYRLFIDIGF